MTGLRVLGLAVVLALAVALPARADTIVLRDWTTGAFANNAAGGGGPFEATATGTLLGPTPFVTFCLEYIEHFSYNVTYDFTLSDAARSGGAGGQVCDGGGNCSDPVSDATMWIYYQVLSGGFASFAQFGTGAGVGARVQEAIWYLENERTSAQISTNSLNLANFALTQDWDTLFNQGHRVWALNLTTASGGPVQDQLGYSRVAVPEPATLALTMMGVGVVAIIRRRRTSHGS
jgi:PEP-CTERM motif